MNINKRYHGQEILTLNIWILFFISALKNNSKNAAISESVYKEYIC